MTPDARALALVPGLQAGIKPLAIAPLTGGSVNNVWRIDTRAGRFVLRTDALLSRRPGVDRQRELVLQTLAAAAGLAVPVLARSVQGDVQVTEYIDARVWQAADYEKAAQLVRLGAMLAQLHHIKVPDSLAPFAPSQLAREYFLAGHAASRSATAAVSAARAEQCCLAIARAESHWPDTTNSCCLVHGDPTAGNVLECQRLWLIDWEYAQYADPIFDIAAVLVYYPAAQQHLAEFLAASELQGAAAGGRLAAAMTIHAGLGWLWRYARGEAASVSAGISAPEWAN